MGWSLTYREPRDPELLDAFFLTIGKALYIANEFEGKCRYVLRLVKLALHIESSGDFDAARELLRSLKDKCLGPTLLDLRSATDDEDELLRLDRAKDARNFIAHEAASMGELWLVGYRQIREQLTRLREEVRHLAAGDNVISRWVYEINEKEHAPTGIQLTYCDNVERWVFAGADDLM